MTERRRSPFLFGLLLAWGTLGLARPPAALAQLVLGQYEDEAPLLSWNAFGAGGAAALGRGLVSLTRADDAGAALANPALLVRLPRLTATLTAFQRSASLRRYSILNTGPLSSTRNLTAVTYGLDFGGAAVRLGDWAFGVSAAVLEDYDRPVVDYELASGGTVLYALSMEQTGFCRGWNWSAARRLSRTVSAGLGLTILDGSLRRTVEERYARDDVTITDVKSGALSGLVFNAGVAWDIGPGLTAAAVFRGPGPRRSDSLSDLRYISPPGGTDIRISASGEEEFRSPWSAGAGLEWSVRKDLRVSVEATHFAWSRYRVTSFGEALARDFRDVVRFGAGAELDWSFRFLGRAVVAPLRAGIVHDPQPMKTPRSAYLCLTLGTGLILDRLRLDGGFLIGRESGSGHGLTGRRLAFSIAYDFLR